MTTEVDLSEVIEISRKLPIVSKNVINDICSPQRGTSIDTKLDSRLENSWGGGKILQQDLPFLDFWNENYI